MSLVLAFGVLQYAPPALAQSDQGEEARSPLARAYGKNNPFALGELPPGRLRQHIEGLPAAAQQRALDWMHRFDFMESDMPYIHVDSTGGVFYEDPIFDHDHVEESGGGGSIALPQEITLSGAFSLHSKPGAARTVYLDMDGHVVTGTAWNNSSGHNTLHMRPYDTNGDDNTFTQSELNDIAEVWKRVAEDFAPYDIDVTTEEPPSFGPNVGHILVTRKKDEFGNSIYVCGCGGVAYVGVWGISSYAYYQPALVFLDGVGGPHSISEAASHELGHNIYLSHDGTATLGYYSGHGSGNTDWAPIMGVGYSAHVTQWSKGEYQSANNQQDDLDIIRNYLGYRVDDHEDVNFAQATPLTVTSNTVVSATTPVSDAANSNPANKGIIEDRSDVDLFYVDVGAGTIDLTITPAWIESYASGTRRGVNLDIEATLYDEFGVQVDQDNPTNDTFARVTASVAAGRYILAIDGVGVGDPLTNGYTDYGSIGQYFINGTVPAAVVATDPPTAPGDLAATPDGDANILLDWTDPPSTLESNEDGYRVLRETDGGGFVQIADLPSDSTGFADNNLASGSYRYQVQVYNGLGTDTSNTTDAIVISLPSVAYATSETSVDGSIQAGSYLDTQGASGSEVLEEEHTGGPRRNRVSLLEHRWNITGVTPGAQVVLEVDAEFENNNDGDDIQFAYAINGGSYIDLPLLNNGTGRQVLSANLPPTTSGTVTLRARDTDRAAGNYSTDRLSVYRIEINSSGDAGDQPPLVTITEPVDGFSASAGETIVFSASATDFEDGDLSGAIAWRSDVDGSLGSSATVNISTLSVGQHLVTAEVTDSADNTGDDSITVNISDPATNNPPQVAITSPANGSSFAQGDNVSFTGTASDPEDGNIASGLSWTSSLDGSIGSGASFSTSGLSVGSHTITAMATDSGGLGDTAQISLTITVPPSGLEFYGMADGGSCGPGSTMTTTAGGSDSATLCGSGFAAGASVSFENGSGPAPSVSSVSVIDSSNISVSFTSKRRGKQNRVWDVRVTNPGGATAVCSGCLTLVP